MRISVEKTQLHVLRKPNPGSTCLWWSNWTRTGASTCQPAWISWGPGGHYSWRQSSQVRTKPETWGLRLQPPWERENAEPGFWGKFWLIRPKTPMCFTGKLRIITFQLLGEDTKAQNLFLRNLAGTRNTLQPRVKENPQFHLTNNGSL